MKIMRWVGKYVVLVVLLSGCSFVQECGKTLWGSSTRALEKARDQALAQRFRCSLEDCYETALELTGSSEDFGPEQVTFQLFLERRRENFFVVMGIPGSVDTTEAGVFFVPVNDSEVRVEVSSLSSNAKARVAEAVFAYLSERFKTVPAFQ